MLIIRSEQLLRREPTIGEARREIEHCNSGLAQRVSARVRWHGPYSAFLPLSPALRRVAMSIPATWLAVGKNEVGLRTGSVQRCISFGWTGDVPGVIGGLLWERRVEEPHESVSDGAGSEPGYLLAPAMKSGSLHESHWRR